MARLERDNKKGLDAQMKDAAGAEQEEAEQAALERSIKRMMKEAEAGQKG